ncbi:Cryptochrome DASH [Vibrio crassostreae]|uniref:DASH family cryptochrome n=1 Tax=Vibrio crassostreae TaxID=246167 RepID=UPI0005EA4CE8|nr:DASH family cryptochrome [Vibrio crassostreae]ROS70604.1 deoxyribodipyrimidine photo-lyase (single-stranded DNA-specific) [Vibrio crassostreae]RPF10262.1 deoxyribodipyrimidine photo-lyase (single-stranded DNA-specific) [Vibrio crassostreae]TCT43979.1 deoxyribodipyrimidine photo-lyase (single-stranded DNA-specific) [Vibrio crassostreae]TCT64343.1 deoxyribodipyrimidine photo-lyase (single-stranded DNA-specific) [Vibrio crassostreae]TCT75953.1 deoxyribodipyrimidine photo-lyase (single-stranded
MKKIGLYLFTNDLRINDNTLLNQASQIVDELVCVAVEPVLSHYSSQFAQEEQYGARRAAFISQSISDLAINLNALEQTLIVLTQGRDNSDNVKESLIEMISELNVTHLFANAHCGYDEQKLMQSTLTCCPNLTAIQSHNSPLFELDDFPFTLEKLPRSFTKFRKLIEPLAIDTQSLTITDLPPAPDLTKMSHCHSKETLFKIGNVARYHSFKGGETSGLLHLEHYFSQDYASCYKQTRNALDGIENSTKFSPWLALGCVSPKTICRHLTRFESHHGPNDSTYWIYFELLWREYFYWKSMSLKASLFTGSYTKPVTAENITQSASLNFAKWKSANTNYPIVDACMRQLNETGYMSNRGRQLAASCLIYELGVDWQHGAAYFESQLIDYDVGSNWGNWAYIAGELRPQVSAQTNKQKNANQAQPKSHHFDLARQTDMYDPDHVFINKWNTFNKEPVLTNNQDVL